jgi:hypothetical protein
MKAFKNARQVFVQSHWTWAEAIQKDMRDITLALKIINMLRTQSICVVHWV